MNDPSLFGYKEEKAGAGMPPQMGSPMGGANGSMAQYKFSPEEMRVLQECNRESFWSRSLPLGAALGLGTGAALQQGYLKPNPRFGAFPKVTLAVIVGYFVGKLSYQQACADKLMALPGSYIGQLLRDRRDGKIAGTSVSQKQAPASMFGATATDIYSDAGPGSSLDLDSDRAGRVFSEDLSRPAHQRSEAGGEAGPGAEARPALSYEELRRQHRGDHAAAKQDPYRVDGPSAPVVRRRAEPRLAPPPTNAYGDVME